MVIAGGYYNGRRTMSTPLTSLLINQIPNPSWRELDWLPEERQWGPAIGLVAGIPTMAGGKNYGDTTIDTLQNEHYWNRDPNRELNYKREFTVGLTVPHTWFPSYCGF